MRESDTNSRYSTVSTSDLLALKEALYDAMRASDACETWAYYGRSSREQLPEVLAELSRRRVNS